MKKYLLIPIFFIAAFAVSYAGCGSCEGDDHDHGEEKAKCVEKCETSCCSKEESKCCAKVEKKCCGETSCCSS